MGPFELIVMVSDHVDVGVSGIWEEEEMRLLFGVKSHLSCCTVESGGGRWRDGPLAPVVDGS